MFEYFFAKKINDRQREIALRELNTTLHSTQGERRVTVRDEAAWADSATSLPLGYASRMAGQIE